MKRKIYLCFILSVSHGSSSPAHAPKKVASSSPSKVISPSSSKSSYSEAQYLLLKLEAESKSASPFVKPLLVNLIANIKSGGFSSNVGEMVNNIMTKKSKFIPDIGGLKEVLILIGEACH